ncbi:MAG TPA: TIGR00730 family Rossman fold protein [Chitinophagaceae bacterium]
MKIQAFAIFCGSKNGNRPIYRQHAAELGKILAAQGKTLIYGGGRNGLMGAAADSVMESGGVVKGVIPQVLIEWEHQHENISELLVVEDMHVRKRKMYELCDAAIILPGGFGTLDELFEMLTWNQLSIHDKQIFILNSEGFYDHLLAHLRHLTENDFLYGALEEQFTVINEPSDLLQYMK